MLPTHGSFTTPTGRKDMTKISGHLLRTGRFANEARQHQEELDHMTSQIDAYPQAALDHLTEHHLSEVIRALIKKIDSMTDALDYASAALKHGLEADGK
jgi:hypothetical protein